MDTFRRILKLPEPRESLPRSSTAVMCLDDEKGRQKLHSIIKNSFDKFDQDFQTANLPEGKYIQPPPSTVKWYHLSQSCYENKIQELNTDFAKICISPKSSGLLWSRFLFQFLKNWNIRLVRIFHSQFRYYLCQDFLFLLCHFGEVSI